MFRSGVVAALMFCCAGSLCAEQVTLKNGDRFTGSILSMSDKKLVLKTEHAGTITIDFDAISQFSSDQPLVVTRTNQQVISGPVKSEDSQVAVTTPSGPQQIPLADVALCDPRLTRPPTRSLCIRECWRAGTVAATLALR